jgi:hypothetical protein
MQVYCFLHQASHFSESVILQVMSLALSESTGPGYHIGCGQIAPGVEHGSNSFISKVKVCLAQQKDMPGQVALKNGSDLLD